MAIGIITDSNIVEINASGMISRKLLLQILIELEKLNEKVEHLNTEMRSLRCQMQI
jgi:tetrahydromethanopterin S-methyltransferase subunit B